MKKNVNGVDVDLTAAEEKALLAEWAKADADATINALAQARAAVNAERDRRLSTTFTFAGKSYDCDTASLARITGAATLAGFAMGAGAAAGNLRWHGGAADFTWIAADNTLATMDAQTCFAFGNAAATNQSAHIFAGRTVKAMDPIPSNYTDDKYWP